MSKASFTLQKSKVFQRAVLFAMINPQPNGAGFAGIKNNVSMGNFEDRQGFKLKLRGQGSLKYWKIVLTDSEFLGLDKLYTYEVKFPVSQDSVDFEIIKLPFADFKAYYRGQEVTSAPPMDLRKIGAFGLQTIGGAYEEFKQFGVGSLEIDFISLY